MYSSLSSRRVLVTGASSGIGEATSLAFAKAGAKVLAVARRADRLKALQQQHSNIDIMVADLSQPSACDQVAQAPFCQQLDILVNNAGLAAGLDLAHQAKLDDWLTMLRINIEGLVRLTHGLLPLMVAGRRGHIVNLGSVAGSNAYPKGNFYGASKAFVAMFSQNLRADLHGSHVRVTNIEPGMVETEFSLVRFAGDQAKAEAVYDRMSPLTASDVADAILWATSRPAHVDVSRIELFPTAQSHAGFAVART